MFTSAFLPFLCSDDKRITVTFRGSVGGEDWSTNLDAKLVELEPPQPLKDLGFDQEIKVHNGFKSKFQHHLLRSTRC